MRPTILAVALAMAGCNQNGTELKVGNVQVFYKDGVTIDEARKLADYMIAQKRLAPGGGGSETKTVQLAKDGGTYQLRVVIKEAFRDDPKYHAVLKLMGWQVSKDVLGGAAVAIHACDERLKTLHTFPGENPYGDEVKVGAVQIFYKDGATAAEAKALAELLNSDPLFRDGVSVQFRKEGGKYLFRFVGSPEAQRNPAIDPELREIGKRISQRVVKDAAVEVHVCDELMTTKRTVH